MSEKRVDTSADFDDTWCRRRVNALGVHANGSDNAENVNRVQSVSVEVNAKTASQSTSMSANSNLTDPTDHYGRELKSQRSNLGIQSAWYGNPVSQNTEQPRKIIVQDGEEIPENTRRPPKSVSGDAYSRSSRRSRSLIFSCSSVSWIARQRLEDNRLEEETDRKRLQR